MESGNKVISWFLHYLNVDGLINALSNYADIPLHEWPNTLIKCVEVEEVVTV